ncbi:autoinducer prepeptide [[Clostridium] sordellii]|nr:cyclic lactone autoinducer peptide [Paeniclostridium sordellii]CEP45507.1 autoinducer prepeptide [[Clostridium] sordellii] [Paeniclostridium sordellii]
MKSFFNNILKNIGSSAIAAVSLSANSTSAWISHQPKIPSGIEKFKKNIS